MKETLTNYRLLGAHRVLIEPADSTIRANSTFEEVGWGRDFVPSVYKQFSNSERLELAFFRNTVLPIFSDPEHGKIVRNFGDIVSNYKDDPEAKQRALERFTLLFTRSYFPEELSQEIRMSLVESALDAANQYIAKFEDQGTGILKSFSSAVGVNNEVQNTNNPIDLLLMCFSANASRKMRFEARRKLILADVALREKANSKREEQISDDVGEFMRFLNKQLWKGGAGSTVPIEFLSTHSASTNECTGVSYLSPLGTSFPEPFSSLNDTALSPRHTSDLIDQNLLTPHTRYSTHNARVFEDSRGHLQWAVFIHREKGDIDKLIKMMRKNTKNPRVIDDSSGFIVVCEHKKNIYEFIKQMQSHAAKQRFVFSIEEASDTIANDELYSATNKGSSTHLECIKFHLMFEGRKIELMFHTTSSYLDYRYKDEISWSEYEVNRVFNSGLIQALYPTDIYRINFDLLEKELIQNRRNENRKVSFAAVPLERKKRTV